MMISIIIIIYTGTASWNMIFSWHQAQTSSHPTIPKNNTTAIWQKKRCLLIYVITVGADRPVNSCILESFNATSTCKQHAYISSFPRETQISIEMTKRRGGNYKWSKCFLRIPPYLRRILFILLDVKSDGCTLWTSSREPEDLWNCH